MGRVIYSGYFSRDILVFTPSFRWSGGVFSEAVMIRNIWFRKDRPSVYLSPKIVNDLKWKTGEWLLMELDGKRIIITKPKNNTVPVRMSKNGKGQFYISMPLTLPKETRLKMFIKRVGNALSMRII
jgi:antitoxin component of MazEF toxin-antitoxin module